MWTAGNWQSLALVRALPCRQRASLCVPGTPVCPPASVSRPLPPPGQEGDSRPAQAWGGDDVSGASAAPGPGSCPGCEDWSSGPQPPPRQRAHLPRGVRAAGHQLHPSPERLPRHLGQQTSSPRSACGTPPQPSLVRAGPLCHLPVRGRAGGAGCREERPRRILGPARNSGSGTRTNYGSRVKA